MNHPSIFSPTSFIGILIAVFFMGAIFLPNQTFAQSVCATTTQNFYSDSSVKLDDGSFATSTFRSFLWTSIPGADWIWSTALVANPNATDTEGFNQDIVISGTVSSSTLTVAADDMAKIFVNNTQIGSLNTENNFSTSTLIDLTSALNANATNTVRIEVTNMPYFFPGQGTSQNNPGGVSYALIVTSQDCPSATSTEATTTPATEPEIPTPPPSNGPIVGSNIMTNPLPASPVTAFFNQILPSIFGGTTANAAEVPENVQTGTSGNTGISRSPQNSTTISPSQAAHNGSINTTGENASNTSVASTIGTNPAAQTANATAASSSSLPEKIGIILIVLAVIAFAGILIRGTAS